MNTYKLALDFATNLTGAITPEQLLEVAQRNAVEPNPAICHSHDFCDANQCLIDALEEQNESFDLHDSAQALCIGEAWNMAKVCAFVPNRVRALGQQLTELDAYAEDGLDAHQETAAALSEVSGITVGPQWELLPNNPKDSQ